MGPRETADGYGQPWRDVSMGSADAYISKAKSELGKRCIGWLPAKIAASPAQGCAACPGMSTRPFCRPRPYNTEPRPRHCLAFFSRILIQAGTRGIRRSSPTARWPLCRGHANANSVHRTCCHFIVASPRCQYYPYPSTPPPFNPAQTVIPAAESIACGYVDSDRYQHHVSP